MIVRDEERYPVPVREFERIGKRLFAEHLVGGNFGNISVRKGDEGFYIKRTGDYLDEVHELVFVPFVGVVPKNASSEYRVHSDVYRNSPHQAIVHAHPQAAIAASLVRDAVLAEDSEGKMFCPKIPVVEGAPGTQELANNVVSALKTTKLVIVRGHGTFAAGKNLDEAFQLTSLADHSCRVIALKHFFQ